MHLVAAVWLTGTRLGGGQRGVTRRARHTYTPHSTADCCCCCYRCRCCFWLLLFTLSHAAPSTRSVLFPFTPTLSPFQYLYTLESRAESGYLLLLFTILYEVLVWFLCIDHGQTVWGWYLRLPDPEHAHHRARLHVWDRRYLVPPQWITIFICKQPFTSKTV